MEDLSKKKRHDTISKLTNGRTNRPSYRDARTHQNIEIRELSGVRGNALKILKTYGQSTCQGHVHAFEHSYVKDLSNLDLTPSSGNDV